MYLTAFFDVASYVASTNEKSVTNQPKPVSDANVIHYIHFFSLFGARRTVSTHPCSEHRHLILNPFGRELGKCLGFLP